MKNDENQDSAKIDVTVCHFISPVVMINNNSLEHSTDIMPAIFRWKLRATNITIFDTAHISQYN